jgi:hypothetical protein
VAFQLCRLSLIGKEHGRIVEKVAHLMSIKRFVSIHAILSLILSVVKYFRFQINDSTLFKWFSGFLLDPIDEYPARFSSIDRFSSANSDTRPEIWAFNVINCLCDFLNYPLFLIIYLVLDIQTALELRKTLAQKMVSINAQAQKDKEDAIFKSNIMVILNALSNLFLKLPMTISSIFEFYVSLNYLFTIFSSEFSDNYFLYFMVDINGAAFFENVANFLYFLSISLNLLFYYNFDRIFKFYFKIRFFKEK